VSLPTSQSTLDALEAAARKLFPGDMVNVLSDDKLPPMAAVSVVKPRREMPDGTVRESKRYVLKLETAQLNGVTGETIYKIVRDAAQRAGLL
jgi:hypothetical protein